MSDQVVPPASATSTACPAPPPDGGSQPAPRSRPGKTFWLGGIEYVELRFVYWNLEKGALDGDDDQRLDQVLDLVAAERADVVNFGEARWSERGNRDGNRRLHTVAQRLGMTARFRVPSQYYECDMAMLVREDKLHVVAERHEFGPPWFHALGRLETVVHGFGRADLVVYHFAPSMKRRRADEAEGFRLLGKQVPVIGTGDNNARAIRDKVNPDAFRGDKEHKLDVKPARILAKAGFRDIGADYDDLSPTVGWRNGRTYRCDRGYHNIPGVKITYYRVIPPTPIRPLRPRHHVEDAPLDRDLSDHGGLSFGVALPITAQ